MCHTSSHTTEMNRKLQLMRAKWHFQPTHIDALPTLLARAVSQKPDIKSDKCLVADLFYGSFFLKATTAAA